MSQAQETETQQRVLLIVADNSLRRLITLGLQYRGMQTIEASSPSALPADEIETKPPALLVLDVDSGVSSDWELLEAVQDHHYLSTLPVVVLAWECPIPVEIASEQPSQITCLAKPFDARALHSRIERLLAEQAEKAALAHVEAQSMQAAAQEEEETAAPPVPAVSVPSPTAPVLAARAQSTHNAASIWPFITAFGLLLAFIGLMVQITLTGLGILIVLAALLLWTLGTRPQNAPLAVSNRLTPVGNGKAT